MENGKIKIWLPTIRTGSGTDIFAQRLAKALEDSGYIAPITWFSLSREPFPFSLKFVTPPSGTDIVISNSWSGFALKRKGISLVVIIHHAAFDPRANAYYNFTQRLYHRMLIRPFELRSFRVADAITAVSDFAATAVSRVTGRNNIQVIHNWIDIQRFCPQENIAPGNKPFRLLFVGKPSRIKGADLLSRIMRQLGTGFELRLAGAWNGWQNGHRAENIHMLGRLDETELIRAYQDCDALLFPSRFEGFGYAVLEAMACGKPVIASRSSALPEVVEDGITGVLCPMDDVSAFVTACQMLSSNADQRRAMGIAGRKRAVNLYSEQAVIPHYIKLIQSLVKPI
jgi:glycosyltransferase involved in cell wall biosynthesis